MIKKPYQDVRGPRQELIRRINHLKIASCHIRDIHLESPAKASLARRLSRLGRGCLLRFRLGSLP